MAHFNFVIPLTKEKLLNETDNNYYVRDQDIRSKLKEAELSFKDKGPEFIIHHFDTFYSIIHLSKVLQVDLVTAAQQLLLQSMQVFKRVIVVALENIESLDHESKLKHRNIMKILLFVYVNFNVAIEENNEKKKLPNVYPAENELVSINRKLVVSSIQAIFQEKINVFWDPPVVDEAFVGTAIKMCYQYLPFPIIISEPELQLDVFHFIGTLIHDYNHSAIFSYEVVQLIIRQVDIISTIPKCVCYLIENYNCKSVVSQLTEELIKSLAKDRLIVSKEPHRCLIVLIDMTKLMPSIMIPEIINLQRYLDDESSAIRYSYLLVSVHIIYSIVTKDNITEEEQDARDMFLYFLERGIEDVAQSVRSYVLESCRIILGVSNLPLKRRYKILKKIVVSLRDEFPNVSLCAVHCVSTFLSANVYGSNLQLHSTKNELKRKMVELNNMKLQFESVQVSKVNELEAEWKEHEASLRTVIEQTLKQELEQQTILYDANDDTLPSIIQNVINNEQYTVAPAILQNRSAIKQIHEWNERSESGESELFILLRDMFMDEKYTSKKEPAEADLRQFRLLQDDISSMEKDVEFLQFINDCIEPMKDLIQSPSFDVTEAAISFFVSIFQYNMDNAFNGFPVMLKLLRSNDPQRTDAVIQAFNTMFLTTKFPSINEQRSAVINNLINVLKLIEQEETFSDFQIIMAQTVANGLINDDIIDLLLNSFAKQCYVSDYDCYYTICLLSMAALGKRRIVTKNLKYVATIGFGEIEEQNLMQIVGVCNFLLLAEPRKDQLEDTHWTDLINILIDMFFVRTILYYKAISQAIKVIYRLCTKPDALCKEFMEKLWVTLSNLDWLFTLQCNHILALIFFQHLIYLEDLYWHNITNAKKQNEGNRNVRTVSSPSQTCADVNATEGAQAENDNFEFLSNVLEKCTILTQCSGVSCLKVMEPWINELCRRLDDSIFEVRHETFYLVSHLILNDMLRSDDCILRMATALVDGEEQLRTMSKKFFTKLFHASQNACNMLSNIIDYLLELEDFQDNDFCTIVKFLFSLITETKQNNVVHSLCLRFPRDEDKRKCKNIAYCLSLITYNEIGLKILLDNFESYQNILHQPRVLAMIRQILNNVIGSRNDAMNALSEIIEEKINSVSMCEFSKKKKKKKKKN